MAQTKQFFTVKPVAETLAGLFKQIGNSPRTQMLPTSQAVGRVLASAPISPLDLPNFTRSAMDGYAVKAADTFGASQSLPAYLDVVGQVHMGEKPDIMLEGGQAAAIHTGAMLPDGADAVVMIERTQKVDDVEIEVLAAVAPGENVIQIGEDVRKGSEALSVGHMLRPQDVGGLLAVGITQLEVTARPKVAVLSCGDELVPADSADVAFGQIRDINSHMLVALCAEAGADVVNMGIARDTLESLLPMARQGLANADMLIMSAGSSVSVRDLTREVVNQLGAPGVIQHGLAVKPGKPTIIAACDGKPVIGLPGNPVSAMLVARQTVLPTLQHLMGATPRIPATINATLTQNIASTTGRADSVPVRIVHDGDAYHAEPIFGKSNLIYTLLRANGLLSVPLNVSGYTAGTTVKVTLF